MNLVVLILIVAVILLLVVLIIKHQTTEQFDSISIQSQINGKSYDVQDLPNSQGAADMLAMVEQRINILYTYLAQNINNYPHFRPYIQQFLERIKDVRLTENPPNGKYTSFTINKGEEIALCLRNSAGELHDINLIMYVVLHELAHVACPEIDHTPLFREIFIFFLNIAIQLGIYTKVNYQRHPQRYCGLTINENLLG